MMSSRGCLSVIYDERTRECRLSRYNQGDRDLMCDAGFDYFESLRGDQSGVRVLVLCALYFLSNLISQMNTMRATRKMPFSTRN